MNKRVYAKPVGSLIGIVSDSDDNVVESADISFRCITEYKEDYQKKTDKYGSFIAHWLPVGWCYMYAKLKINKKLPI